MVKDFVPFALITNGSRPGGAFQPAPVRQFPAREGLGFAVKQFADQAERRTVKQRRSMCDSGSPISATMDKAMLRLTKKADYGLMALKFLAERPEYASQSAKDIADAYGIPPQLLAKILQRLAKVGLLRSHAGMNGGYSLALPASQMTAFEVIRAIDGPLFITSCDSGLRPCDLNDSCTIKEPLRKVNDSIADVLKALSIADLCESEEALQRHATRQPSGYGATLVTLRQKAASETLTV